MQRVNILMRNIIILEQYGLYTQRVRIKMQFKELETVRGNIDRNLGDKVQEQMILERINTLN